jgi:ureidoacrylate peracid hydrolase
MAQEPLPSQPSAPVVAIEAQPAPIQIDAARTAVLVIDMQNDFGAKGGMFDRAGIDVSLIQRAVGPTARVLTAARQAAIPVVYLKMAFQADLSDAGPADAPNWLRHHPVAIGTPVQAPDGTASRILIRDTWNTDILPELAPQAGDFVLYKRRFSGFYATDLDATLKRCGAKYLLVTAAPRASAWNRRSAMRCFETIAASSWPIARPSRWAKPSPAATMKRRSL